MRRRWKDNGNMCWELGGGFLKLSSERWGGMGRDAGLHTIQASFVYRLNVSSREGSFLITQDFYPRRQMFLCVATFSCVDLRRI